MAQSDFLEAALLDLRFGGTAYTIPATWYVALFTAAPTDSGGGTEVAGNGYARAPVPNNTTSFGAATLSGKTTSVAITWPLPTANWGTVVAIGFFDAASGGNMQDWGLLTTPKAILIGVAPRIEIGALVITQD